jgi:antitoxin HicB
MGSKTSIHRLKIVGNQMDAQKKDLAYYLGLPYTIEVTRDNDEENPGWVARILELPGCITQGDNFEELDEMIKDAMREWLEIALEDNLPIPEPTSHAEYSGKFVVRVPKFLHRELVERAVKEGVSLNAYITAELGKAVGSRPINSGARQKENEKMTGVDIPKEDVSSNGKKHRMVRN